MIKYKDKEGNLFKYLAAGIYKKQDTFESVVVYCPNDNEHSIFIMGEKEFYNKFEIVMED